MTTHSSAFQSLRLGVNVDHVATLRQVRGTDYPSPVEAAEPCLEAGAIGITVHLREDRRHIQEADVRGLRRTLADRALLNLEMANHPAVVAVALDVRPDEVCLVPERREELTTEGGLDAAGQADALAPTVRSLTEAGIEVSLFIEPEEAQIRASVDLGAPCIELHTGTFCLAEGAARRAEGERLAAAAEQAHGLGLRVNAGHGLHAGNVRDLFGIPYLDTLNIGHSIVARSVFVGMRRAVEEMLEAMQGYAREETS